MTKYEIDSAYIRRCHKQLKEWGAPLTGWTCEYVYDVADGDDDVTELATCELCRCTQVRFIHVMVHPDFYEKIEVGCICAGIMEGDILGAKEREREMKNRAKRKQHFPNRRWHQARNGNLYLTYQGQTVFLNRNGQKFNVHCNGKTAWDYKGKPISSFLSAAYAAFDLADPIEAYQR